MVIVQLITGLLLVGVTVWIAASQGRSLVQNSLSVQLSRAAEEVEKNIANSADSTLVVGEALRLNLQSRFPDPVYILAPDGRLRKDVEISQPFDAHRHPLPANLKSHLDALENHVEMPPFGLGYEGTWGVTPIVKQDRLVGGLLILPMTHTAEQEMAGVQSVFVRYMWLALGLGVVLALAVGGWLTWLLVKPLRRMTQQVEAIGAGHYSARLSDHSRDELGRLAGSINQMSAEIQRSIEELRKTDLVRRELVANIGHDLRTPIAAISGYLEEAQRFATEGQQEKAKDAMETAHQQTQYLKRLTQDLFELSLFEGGHQPLNLEPVPMGELLHESARAHRKAFAEDELQFQTDWPAGLPTLEGDGLRLLRVLDNLLSNARRHTAPGGLVTLRARIEPEELVISVEDSGVGIAPEDLAHIFERYYRGSDARTRGAKGTGLGLAICKVVAEAHQGRLTVQSVSGKGSTFSLHLPLNRKADFSGV